MILCFKTLIALAAFGAVSACTQETTGSEIDRKITVTGSHAGVQRFVALQKSLRPRIATSNIEIRPDGRFSVTATIPVTYSGSDIVQTSREALAAGLSYQFEDQRATVTTRS